MDDTAHRLAEIRKRMRSRGFLGIKTLSAWEIQAGQDIAWLLTQVDELTARVDELEWREHEEND